MLFQEQLVDLLDRKFNLVNDLLGREFFLELVNFVDFIINTEQIRIFLDQLDNRFYRKNLDFVFRKLQLISDVQQIRRNLANKLPQNENEHNISPPDETEFIDPHHPFYSSLTYFDDLAQKTQRNTIQEPFAHQNNNSIEKLCSILRNHTRRESLSDQEFEEFFLQIHHAEQKLDHLKKEIANYFRASSEGALQALRLIASNVNPEPSLPKSWTEIPDEVIKSFVDPVTREKKRIQEVTYQGAIDEDLVLQAKLYLRRGYEGLRAEISSFLMHSKLIERYKIRATWYDRQRIEYLINQNEGKEEDILTRDLALYLFDNGISTLYRIRRGVHEYDLISDEIKSNLFIEVKVYKSSKDLTKGFAQLHSYLNSLEAQSSIEEVYYIIFRLGGPLYDLPPSIPTNRRIFYPMIIDLGSSSESGSRQPSPVYLKLDDFFSALEKEVEEEE